MGIINKLLGKKEVVPGELSSKPEFKKDVERNEQIRQDKYKNVSGVIREARETYGGYSRPKTYRMSSTARGVIEAVGGRLPTKYQGKKGYSSRGRPKGPSGRYYIPGKGAVGVFEYRKYASYQRRMAQMQQTQQLSEQPQRYNYPQPTQPYQQQNYPQPIPQQPPMQSQAYAGDIPATQFTPFGDFNALKIKMPNLANTNPQQFAQPKNIFQQQFFPTQKPVTNPQGDWYTTADGFTGKMVLRRRVREFNNQW